MSKSKKRTKGFKMRVVAYINDKLGIRLKDHIDKTMGGRHGAISIIVERAIQEYLDREDKKN